MACVPVDALTKEQSDELLCTYAAMILHDDGAEINQENLNTLIKAANCSVEGYWPALFSKLCNNVGMENLFKMGGGGGGGGGAAAGGAAAGGEAAKEEKVVEEEEEEDMDFDL